MALTIFIFLYMCFIGLKKLGATVINGLLTLERSQGAREITCWADLEEHEERALLEQLEVKVTRHGGRFHYRQCGSADGPGCRTLGAGLNC